MRVEKPPSTEEFESPDIEEIGHYLNRKDVREFFTRVNNKYFHWDVLRHLPIPVNTKAELLWFWIKNLRDANATHKFIELKNEKIDLKYNLPSNISQKLHEFDLNLGGNLQSRIVIPEEDKERYLINSIMEESIASSQLEGAATTRKVAKEMLRTKRKPENKNEKMIFNNYNTILMIKEMIKKNIKLTPENLLQIHASMTKGTLTDEKAEGAFRQNNEIKVVDSSTGEINYHPPDYKLIPELIGKICEFANDDSEFIHPIIKASILHFLLGYVHAFEDGNGRTARAVFYWYLITKGYWLLEFMSISRIIKNSPSQYARAYLYTETDDNDLTYFIIYQIRTMDIALKELKSYINKKLEEKKKIYVLLTIKGVNERQAYLLKSFLNNPMKTITINEVQSIFGVVYQTARADLLDLMEMGFLEKKIIGRNRSLFFRSKDFENKIKSFVGEEFETKEDVS